MPLGVYVTYAESAGTPAGSVTRNLFNANPNDRKAAILGLLGIVPGKISVLASCRRGDNGRAVSSRDDAWMIGGTYSLLQSVQLQLNYTEYSGNAYRGSPANGTRMTTLMFYSAF